MGNTKINQRTFVVKAGMTPEDVVKSANATPQQKKYAVIFDSDGIKGYSQREADIFNSTTITERGNQGISLWTRYANGSKKETKFKGDISSFKFTPANKVKPYIVSKKQTNSNKQTVTNTKVYEKAPVFSEALYKDCKSWQLETDSYDYKIVNAIGTDDSKITDEYYRNNRLLMHKRTKNGQELEYRLYNTDGSLYCKRP